MHKTRSMQKNRGLACFDLTLITKNMSTLQHLCYLVQISKYKSRAGLNLCQVQINGYKNAIEVYF